MFIASFPTFDEVSPLGGEAYNIAFRLNAKHSFDETGCHALRALKHTIPRNNYGIELPEGEENID